MRTIPPARDPVAERLPYPETDFIFSRLRAEVAEVENLRWRLHLNPRLSGDEEETLNTLLDEIPSSFSKSSLPGAIGVVRIGPAGPSVALRAEMDALPLVEQTGLPWASTNGAMHACGHDVHMAAFVAVTRTLASVGDLPAPLVGLLQPREETGESGARQIVDSGILEHEQVKAVIGAHLQPALDCLGYACTPGAVNAAADEFSLRMSGKPSHGAYPHHSSDPLLAASAFVVSCQQIVARNVDPVMSAVLTIGTINAGGSPNAIPEEAIVTGTIRTMSESQRDMMHLRLGEVANGVATAHDCRAQLAITRGEPILKNDPALASEVSTVLKSQGHELSEFRSYGADDFAFYGCAVPSVMIFAGSLAENGNLHSNTFAPDDDAIMRVASAMLAGYLAAADWTPRVEDGNHG